MVGFVAAFAAWLLLAALVEYLIALAAPPAIVVPSRVRHRSGGPS